MHSLQNPCPFGGAMGVVEVECQENFITFDVFSPAPRCQHRCLNQGTFATNLDLEGLQGCCCPSCMMCGDIRYDSPQELPNH